jgi:hypothetical protein
MWMRKLPTEVSSEKHCRLLRRACLDVLLGTGLWFVLVKLFAFLGLPYRTSPSSWVACGVVAIVLLAGWHARRQARKKLESTMVCDRCNAVKAADGKLDCNCGGQYLPLPEMKWINAKPSAQAPLERRK